VYVPTTKADSIRINGAKVSGAGPFELESGRYVITAGA
jgi:hypothetical protein